MCAVRSKKEEKVWDQEQEEGTKQSDIKRQEKGKKDEDQEKGKKKQYQERKVWKEEKEKRWWIKGVESLRLELGVGKIRGKS